MTLLVIMNNHQFITLTVPYKMEENPEWIPVVSDRTLLFTF